MSDIAASTIAEPNETNPRPTRARRRRAAHEGYRGIWIATLAVFGAGAVFADGTLTSAALSSMLPFASVLALAAAGQTLVIQSRGIDLSVPGVMSLTALVFAKQTASGTPIPLAILAACGVALVCGALNGVLVAVVGITPLVATLATGSLLVGAEHSYSSGFPITVTDSIHHAASSSRLGIPNTVYLAVLVVAAVAVISRFTVVGRRFVAAGASPATARAAGIRVTRYTIGTYMCAALCYAAAGMVLAAYVGTADIGAGNSYLLPVIAAVVIGGTAFTGGRGSVVATAVGALFLSQLDQLLFTMGLPTSLRLLVQSCALVAATGARRLRSTRPFTGSAPRKTQMNGYETSQPTDIPPEPDPDESRLSSSKARG
ncbi:ABC transporter permease [Embleya hyalina]|uniref:Transporter n=1 Tax=Embleya hyalina TaxID=516124 RepID=A0A401YR14_9ACTN|nr:ABC transporter permease [Embleya hyalina]GCD96995.1 transporter [Embleya hyalina]